MVNNKTDFFGWFLYFEFCYLIELDLHGCDCINNIKNNMNFKHFEGAKEYDF